MSEKDMQAVAQFVAHATGAAKWADLVEAGTEIPTAWDKPEYEPMLKMLARSGQVVVLTKPASLRALSLAKLKEVCRHLGLRAYACTRSGDAIGKAFDLSGRRGKILVCGSIYLLGEVMERLNYHPSRINLCQ